MNSEIKELISAIRSLQTNVVQDYILPVCSILISSFVGFWSAHYAVNKQEHNKIELGKIKSANNIIILAIGIDASLKGFKQNYFGEISDDPISRILSIPPIISDEERVNINLSELSFINPKIDELNCKWVSLSYLSTLFGNFNTLLALWNKITQLAITLRETTKKLDTTEFTYDQLIAAFEHKNLIEISDLTERCILLTDDLIIEFNCFLIGFYEMANSKIDKKVLRKFGRLLKPILQTYETSPMAVDLMSRSQTVDYKKLSYIHNESEIELRQRYQSIYS